MISQTTRRTKKDNRAIQEKNKTLKEHFNNKKGLIQRNKDIINVIEDEYKQSQIAKYLKVSPAMISKAFRGAK